LFLVANWLTTVILSAKLVLLALMPLVVKDIDLENELPHNHRVIISYTCFGDEWIDSSSRNELGS